MKVCNQCKKSKELTEFRLLKDKYLIEPMFSRNCIHCLNRAKRHRDKHKQQIQSDYKNRHISRANSISTRWNALKRRAFDKGFALDISKEDLEKMLKPRKCFYCIGPLNPYGFSLDRVDNEKGYVLGNIVPCCRECNVLKMNLPVKKLVEKCKSMLRRFGYEINDASTIRPAIKFAKPAEIRRRMEDFV